MIQLIELNATEHADRYKAFFLKGLRENAAHFRMTYADDLSAPFPTHGTADSFTLAAVDTATDAEAFVAVVSFEREGANREKLQHKGLIFRMLVDTAYQGKGIGRMILEETLHRARQAEGIEQVNLTVVNPLAKKLYTSLGFRTFAVEERAQKHNGSYQTEETMVLFLTNHA